MPITIRSRYHGLTVQAIEAPDGSVRATVALRPPTPPQPRTQLYKHLVTGVENIEYLAWRYYGSSDAWWRIAEANPLAFPLDVKPGTPIAVPAADDLGRVVRTRSV
jgi:hypothetical protein